MRNGLLHYLAILPSVILMLTASSCESQPQWGDKLIYMPQAAIMNNIDHEYPVPMVGQKEQNYRLDGDKLEIFLGVYVSGLGDLKSYQVDVYHDAAASGTAAGSSADRAALPTEAISIPEKVTVESGQRQKTFYLTVDLEKVRQIDETLFQKNLIAVIGIKNPTLFNLNEELSATTVVIDGTKFQK